MILGTYIKNGERFCASCSKQIKSEKENYCFNCGNPIADDAVMLRVEQIKTIKLELIDDLINEINDIDSLNVLKEKVNQIKNSY